MGIGTARFPDGIIIKPHIGNGVVDIVQEQGYTKLVRAQQIIHDGIVVGAINGIDES